jgi:hypothetical protein
MWTLFSLEDLEHAKGAFDVPGVEAELHEGI